MVAEKGFTCQEEGRRWEDAEEVVNGGGLIGALLVEVDGSIGMEDE
jgi:hypothetical protein